jgi:hypothetical protein
VLHYYQNRKKRILAVRKKIGYGWIESFGKIAVISV